MLDDAGLDTDTHAVPNLDAKYNVIAKAGPQLSKQGLLLAGHTDTVPCTPASWNTDPFTLTEADGKLYGLGSCDMKGFFAVIAEALAMTDLTKLRSPVQVWATANEECGMEGAAYAAANTPACACALVGEPTDLIPVYAHKGAMAESIVCTGKSGHASNPAGGASAVSAIGRIMDALDNDFAQQIKQSESQPDFQPPHSTHNFGLIRGGDAFNRIADRCEIWIDVRLMPGTTVAAARKRLRSVASSAVANMPGIRVQFAELVAGFAAVKTDPAAPIVAAAVELSGVAPRTAPYATEAPYYSKAGMDVVVMGAGNIAVAHQPNEFVPINQVDQMAHIVARLIEQFCMRTPD